LSAKALRLGVSACLLGQKVRFDGGHKHDNYTTDVLARWFELVPMCPEMEIGLGTPRESLRLIRSGAHVRLVAPKSDTDITDTMQAYAAKRARSIARQRQLCGFVLKKDSPSCGLERVRVYGEPGVPARDGRGLFAAALVDQNPALPAEEEGRLNDPRLRENFLTRVFAYSRWLALEDEGMTRAKLFRFHEHHKYVLMAHSQTGLRSLGNLLGSAAKSAGINALAARYLEHFTAIMQRVPTPKNHTNVLQHVAGYVTEELDAADRAELMQTIEAYRLGHLPLIVPVTLVRHYVRKFKVAYLLDQVYLSPHPHELMLLNHV
jgi:uncharacterized protein YbgA (DUF1722 family)/uncharacterized protein YbbK (DUF523 family)